MLDEVLDEATWQERARAHAARLEPYVAPHLARREARIKHPVHDFLFTYYSQRPAQLMRWHPGFGVALGGDASAYVGAKGYGGAPVAVTPEYVASQRPLISSLHRLLTATAARQPTLGCFGLHEWAMVYQLDEDEVRHKDWSLRLGPTGTDEVVESHRITCSHFDAFRFFTPQARGLNLLQPASDDRAAYEQPGCLHGGMDLYGKVAVRLTPMIPSELVADAFELAWDIRIMDMRAAPYDLSGITLDPTGEEWTPIKIETPEGKREYADQQREFAERGAPIRQRLIQECERLLRS
ncbi:3-methyladenine DNA glycosylase [Nocardioides sp. AE5]|uniref:3-methyladenine DNA glycosylase n=1 Tax=Nocardioides sp. AE5 TaxID=2962573 RepID=UPI002881B5F4|nr:3-methyladenine DNA glycosylase [Nocardioides sp. AE5]MDT0202879.1 3-methyladenine DNA glycosylase [Nocardioides sp. AE5]